MEVKPPIGAIPWKYRVNSARREAKVAALVAQTRREIKMDERSQVRQPQKLQQR